MKTKTLRFSKSHKNVLFLIALVFLFISIFFLVKSSNLEIEVTCEKISEKKLYCEFDCIVTVKRCGEFSGRAVVTHSGWAAIHDEIFNFTCNKNLLIELPKRYYNYVIRVGVYDGKNFGSDEKTISC